MIDEAQALGLRAGAYALIRQVYLLCEGRPRVYARTVIPASTLRAERRLASLGSRPLGDLLFGDAAISRGYLQAAPIPAHHPLFHLATRKYPIDAEIVWGRRSLFYLRSKPLLIVEIFFPGVWH
jgi:chorismate--pyruvate lyase